MFEKDIVWKGTYCKGTLVNLFVHIIKDIVWKGNWYICKLVCTYWKEFKKGANNFKNGVLRGKTKTKEEESYYY